MAIRLSGMVSGMDTDSMVKELVNVQRLKNKKVTDNKTRLTWQQDKWKELNVKLYKLYADDLAKLKLQSSYLTKQVSSSNDSLVSVTASTSAPLGAHAIEITQLASAQYITGSVIKDVGGNVIPVTGTTTLDSLGIVPGSTFTIGTNTFPVTDKSTINDFVEEARNAGLNASFDVTNQRFFISSKESGEKNAFQLTANDNALLGKLGLGADMTVISPADSIIMYNGAEIKSNSNQINVNGLTINLKGLSNGEKINLSVNQDLQSTYDMVKKFVKSYNEILGEMNKLYNADSAKDYAPLSDEEKESMSESQIEKWESKIKDAGLRRDSTLGSLINSVKSVTNERVEVDGKNYSLSSFGIMTSKNYLERGLLHIDGDIDDPDSSFKQDKLMKALMEDPDTVMKVLSGIEGIGTKLYDDMAKRMKSVPDVSSALTFYNDKLMDTKQKKYDEEIAKLEKRLVALEEKYYNQFSKMETALSRLQSQSNSLLSMLGTSN